MKYIAVVVSLISCQAPKQAVSFIELCNICKFPAQPMGSNSATIEADVIFFWREVIFGMQDVLRVKLCEKWDFVGKEEEKSLPESKFCWEREKWLQ